MVSCRVIGLGYRGFQGVEGLAFSVDGEIAFSMRRVLKLQTASARKFIKDHTTLAALSTDASGNQGDAPGSSARSASSAQASSSGREGPISRIFNRRREGPQQAATGAPRVAPHAAPEPSRQVPSSSGRQAVEQHSAGGRPMNRPQLYRQPYQRPQTQQPLDRPSQHILERSQGQQQNSRQQFQLPRQAGVRPSLSSERGGRRPPTPGPQPRQDSPPASVLEPEDLEGQEVRQRRRDRSRLTAARGGSPGPQLTGGARPPAAYRPRPGSSRQLQGPDQRARPPPRRTQSQQRGSFALRGIEGPVDPVTKALLEERGKHVLQPGEPMAFLNKDTGARIRSDADMPMPPANQAVEAARASMLQFDPIVNLNWGSPARQDDKSAEQLAEEQKEEWMQELGLTTDEEWQELKKHSLEGVEEDVQAMQDYFRIRDTKADEAALETLVKSAMPADHPNFPHIEMSLRQLQNNPWWTFEQKEKYLKSVVTQLA